MCNAEGLKGQQKVSILKKTTGLCPSRSYYSVTRTARYSSLKSPQVMVVVHCPKSKTNFRDITRNVEENEILHEIFRVVSRFPRNISCYILENRLPLGQCGQADLCGRLDGVMLPELREGVSTPRFPCWCSSSFKGKIKI